MMFISKMIFTAFVFVVSGALTRIFFEEYKRSKRK